MTIFAGVTPATLDTTKVVVEGYPNAAGTLVARIIRNPSNMAGQMDSDAYDGLAPSLTRSRPLYRAMRR